MAETEDIQPLVVDNGTGMVKVRTVYWILHSEDNVSAKKILGSLSICALLILMDFYGRLDLPEMMLLGLCFRVSSGGQDTQVLWWGWDKRMPMLGMKLSPREVYLL